MFSSKEELCLADEIKNLLQKCVIKESHHEEREFISPIFLIPKSEGSVRMVLDLKRLNENLPNIHFIDDLVTLCGSFAECERSTKLIVTLLDNLVFAVHPYKSIFFPARSI